MRDGCTNAEIGPRLAQRNLRLTHVNKDRPRRRNSPQLLDQEVHEQPVMEAAVGTAFVAAHHAHGLEADALVGLDRTFVRGGRVDRETVVAALVSEPADRRAKRFGTETGGPGSVRRGLCPGLRTGTRVRSPR